MKRPRKTKDAPRTGSPRYRVVLFVLLLAAGGFAFYRVGRHVWGEYHLRKLETAIEGRDWTQAQTSLKHCLAVWPGKGDLHLIAAQIARREKDYPEAQRHLSLARENGSVPEAIALEQRLTQIQRGDLSGETELHQYCLDHPHTPESALILEALIEGRLFRLDTARAQEYVDLWRSRPSGRADQAQACLWQALIHELNQSPGPARREYEQAIQLAPGNRQARLSLAALVADDDPEAAARHVAVLERDSPDDVEVLLLSARVHHNLGRLEEAAGRLDRLLGKSPDHVDALAARGRLALQMRRTESAGQWLRRAEQLAPKHREVLLSMIEYQRAIGNAEEAERYQERMTQVGEEIERYMKSRLQQIRASGAPERVQGPAPPGQG